MSQSPFQRFVREMRRRHVPQTAAIYLVAAWAIIEFSDVVVPNLNGPQWIVTAVIIAALVGFPIMLVVAWIFEWGPEGIYRTGDTAAEGMETPPSYDETAGEVEPASARKPTAETAGQPWLAAVVVLCVVVGGSLGVAYLLRGGSGGPDDGRPEASAPAAGGDGGEVDGAAGDTRRPGARQADSSDPIGAPPPPPGVFGGQELFPESVRAVITRSLGVLDSMDLSELAELGRRAALEAGVGIGIRRPEEWRLADVTESPVALEEGATLLVEGVAFDPEGIVRVEIEGRTVIDLGNSAESSVTFTAALRGRGSAGTRTVPIVAFTADGREIRREYSIVQLPGGTP